MGRPPCCDKTNVKRGIWTAEEDAKILAYVSNYGIGNWTLVPKKAGLNRCGKSCRLRWTNYLRPDLKHDGFTPQEEDLIINLHKAIGSRWSLIAKQLPGRTDNDVKNYWNTKLRKRLSNMGIDPVTHKPYTQILSEYGNINGLPGNNLGGRIGLPLNRTTSNINNMRNSSTMPGLGITSVQQQLTNNNSNAWEFQPHPYHVMMNQYDSTTTPSSSSSSCSSYTVNQIINSPLPFSCPPPPQPQSQPQPQPQSSSFVWTDFLTGVPAVCSDEMQAVQETYQVKSSGQAASNGSETYSHSEEVSSSTAKSFLDALLDQDNQIKSEFPQLLNDILNTDHHQSRL